MSEVKFVQVAVSECASEGIHASTIAAVDSHGDVYLLLNSNKVALWEKLPPHPLNAAKGK